MRNLLKQISSLLEQKPTKPVKKTVRRPNRRAATSRRSGKDRREQQKTGRSQERRTLQKQASADRRAQSDRRQGDRRAESDRRGENRRTKSDRRKQQQPIAAPDQRKSNRRQANERRTSTRRRTWEEEVPLLEWSPEQDIKKPKKKKKPQNLAAIASIGAAAILLIAFVAYVSLKEPKTTKRVVKEDPFKNIGKPKPRAKKVAEVKEEPVPDEVRILGKDIVKIAPTVYKSVEIEIEHLPPSIKREIQFIIKGLIISVISKTWNGLTGSNKVDLLNRTFALLSTRYPGITPFVTLKFDDNRRDLDLKFDDFVKKGRAWLSNPVSPTSKIKKEQTADKAG